MGARSRAIGPVGAEAPGGGRRSRGGRWLVLLCLFWLLPRPAAAINILPGQSFEVSFTLSGPAPSADVLTFSLDHTATAVGVTGMTVSLYDGSTLLASRNSPFDQLSGFVDAGSQWTTNAVTADLSSIQDGSITGRIVATPSFDGAPGDQLDAVFFPLSGLVVGQATGPDSLVPLANGSLVIGTPFALPEPDGLELLAVAGLFAVTASGRGSRRGA